MRHMLKRRSFYQCSDTPEGYILLERTEQPIEKGLLPKAGNEAAEY
jgi:hypothetical protein